MARLLLAMAVLPLAWLGACAGPLNHESSIGQPNDPEHGVELGTINPDAPRPYADQGLYDESPWKRPAGSLTGIDRDNWSEQTFLVPVDGTSHQPTYSVHPDYANELARERGLYPDETTCLDLRSDHSNELQALEAVAAPVYSGLDIVLWIPRAVLVPPWSTVQSPGAAYERRPRLGESWVMRPAPPPESAVQPGPTPPPANQEPYPEPAHYNAPETTPPASAPTPPQPAPENPPKP
jgi:hypothetical protein